jgi:DNA repair protein RadC
MVQEAGQRLARAEALSRPLLNTPEKLLAYLDPPRRLERDAHLAVLFLNNRNQLLAEESWPDDATADTLSSDIARRVVQVHATALILVRSRPGTRPRCLKQDHMLTEYCRRLAEILSLALHDHLILGKGEPFSCRAMRLL